MSSGDIIPALLLILFGVSFSIGAAVVIAVVRASKENRSDTPPPVHRPPAESCSFRRPDCWVAVKSQSVIAVQAALGLNNPRPCSWFEGLAGEEKLFIAPPVRGWILVMGSRLPDPGEDVDACFRFITNLSRKIGQVQFFCASSVLRHHAWVKADGGRVIRAYAWAGRTVWHQGCLTPAERLLNLTCYEYSAPDEGTHAIESDAVTANVDRVPLLAARWSLDPARLDERYIETETGVAGEPSCRF